MKAILEFDFDDPEKDDRVDHARMLKANDMCAAIYDMQQYFRSKLKYSEDFGSGEKEVEDAQAKLFELLDSHGVNMNELFN